MESTAAQSGPSSSPDQSERKPRPIRVVLVDDHKLFRTGVRAELDEAGAGGVQVVGEAQDAPGAVAVIARERPDVVLLDVHLPGGSGGPPRAMPAVRLRR